MAYKLFIMLTMFLIGIDNQKLSDCKPNSYIFLGCNVCRCDAEGKINKQLCTQRKCPEARRSFSVNGSCEPGTWYSSETCQICYCIYKSKLVCNRVANQSNLQLGNFSFTICGHNYLESASQLTNRPMYKKYNVFKGVKNKEAKTESDLNTEEILFDLLGGESKVKDDTSLKNGISESDDEVLEESKNILDLKTSQDYIDGSSLTLGSLRRGKVRLIGKESCTPGESFTKHCENCFCLHSGKLLCVQKKSLHSTLWSEKCKKREVVLNDCNWCRCDERQRYSCKARVCNEIDMFGHFNDAIRDIDVGMEGHGVWRSSPSSCSPGVHYRRGSMLCVCKDDGHWPSPVCRDIFRVLHSVEITPLKQFTSNYTCIPTKLYVVGCNVCFCPSNGYLDQALCTQNTCHKDDPILKANTTNIARTDDTNDNIEVYAYCTPNVIYNIGCMPCKCLKNNRLICETCSQDENSIPVLRHAESMCYGMKTNVVFENDCNLCYCDERGRKICTARKCINYRPILDVKKYKGKFTLAPSPVDDVDCTPGTKFNKNCNICKCNVRAGKKYIQCTMNMCNTSSIDVIKSDCVVNTSYELKCMICHCQEVNGEKTQSCYMKEACHGNKRPTNVSKLNGYCEPLTTYIDDCNQCRCLSDGETLLCTTKVCLNKKDPISVEIVPIKRNQMNDCRKGHSFKVTCNVCYCITTNSALCTTAKCYNSFKIKPGKF